MTESYQFVKAQNASYLSPSVLKSIAEKHLVSKKALGIEYPGEGKAAVASYYDETHYEKVYINPYSGDVFTSIRI